MPGLYAHMDVARRALSALATNPGAAALFAADGPSAAELEQIARDHPAYTALGALGPDMFFLLPDFKPPLGTGLWGAANFLKDFVEGWDENFLEPWENTLEPIAMNNADTLGALTGGVLDQLGAIAEQGIAFLIAFVEVALVRQYDIFGLLGSGVPEGYDEQTFFWSDMFHYRKTFEFGRHLFTKAQASGNDAHLAFALGWMSHLATDVTGHAFTNEKCGGPYRLHWQRHKLVENHMDARVVDAERGGEPIYNMLNNSALHLWIAFNPDGTSRHDFFDSQPGPTHATGDTTLDLLDREKAWDVDSDLPAGLAQFIAGAAREFFADPGLDTGPNGATASHPTIIADLDPGPNGFSEDGYADPEAVTTTYWWLFKYLKWTTTDYYSMRYPEFEVITVPPFPSPPGSGTPNDGPGGDDADTWDSALDILLAILAWLLYLAQVLAWAATALVGIVTTLATAPIRYLVYELLEVPLYNAWAALHWYLAYTGLALPMRSETSRGLMTLGVTPADAWGTLQSALNDLSGGLIVPPEGPASEPSGAERSLRAPREAVVDKEDAVLAAGGIPITNPCAGGPAPSAFVRPWLFPLRNLAQQPVDIERTSTRLSPYPSLTDATALIAPLAGDPGARADFEQAGSEQETVQAQNNHLPLRTLGGPVDFTGYVVARLTRDDPGTIPNFNLDADRGYGYLCWDWVRDPSAVAAPEAYRDDAQPANSGHQYSPPASAGYGWCDDDVISGTAPPVHDPNASPPAVRIRYIDLEAK
ncbi:hypothetical protein AB0J86_18970 [Micromonospora sp. NPDC049559]|uniref:hypothetical protein n=1 Tax=Micromonospora sp. NPDC049559 TaxID=3155923 RepID=UPI003434CCAC